jgi:hypothetical protein
MRRLTTPLACLSQIVNLPSCRTLIGLAACLLGLVSESSAEQATSSAEPATSSADQQLRFFEQRIRPLLVAKCYECHADDKVEGGLRLDLANSITKGGDSGAVIVPGQPDESLLVAAIRYKELEMPPDEPLSEQEQADLVRWIKSGAYWPVDKVDSESPQSGETKTWWAAQPLDSGTVPGPSPEVRSRTTIDRYIDRRLDQAGLHRAPAIDRARLIRRLSYNLLGLPPTPEAIARFVNDDRPDAYRRLVDRMFADPAYGERMARLWLDLVRYAESDGWRADAYRPQAWRYRQFVVDAFNSGMPYDRFVALHIAGDEISPDDEQALAAVGFLRLGIYEYNQRDAEGQWQNIVDEITDVTADVFLATGMACAKCHDHKFDPISRADYFRMRSVFEPVSFQDWKPRHPNPDSTAQARIDDLLAQLREIEGVHVQKLGSATVDKFPLHLQAMYRKPPAERNTYEHQMAYLVGRQYLEEGLAGNKLDGKIGKEATAKRKTILEQLDRFGANPYAPAKLMTIADALGDIRPTRIPGRSTGQSFLPGTPGVFGEDGLRVAPPSDAPQSSGRRSALAQWIVSAETPITPRVMVNRLWQYHFGTGLVSSPNDFGHLGSKPSHPQLLDHLAKEFVDSGWNIQAIQRQIVTSATYRQSPAHPDAEVAMNVDADNRLLWHKTVRRLDAEQYRDSLLVVMNSLIDHVGGPSISGTGGRRSIYLRRLRNSADEMLANLDAPPGLVGTAKRDVTTTALQSLMMMNSPRILGVAKKFAARVDADVRHYESSRRGAAFVRRAHRLITAVEADEHTVQMLAPLASGGSDGQVDVCHILLNSNAFLFID